MRLGPSNQMRPHEFASIDLHLVGQQRNARSELFQPADPDERSLRNRPGRSRARDAERLSRDDGVVLWRRSRSLAAPSTQAVPDVAY
jgi:hypothetical protein